MDPNQDPLNFPQSFFDMLSQYNQYNPMSSHFDPNHPSSNEHPHIHPQLDTQSPIIGGTQESFPTYSTQDDVQEEEAEEEPSSGRVARRQWSEHEDELLLSAWLNTSKDAVQGNSQSLDKFWARIATYYNSRRDKMAPRDAKKCRARFQRISADVSKFAGNFSQATRARASGQSADDVMNNARILYTEDHEKHGSFKNEHAWRILRHEQKWQISSQKVVEGSSKRTKLDPSGSYTSGSNPSTPMSETGSGGSCSRPPGVKATKRAGKRVAGSCDEPKEDNSQSRNQMLGTIITIRERELKMKEEQLEIMRESQRFKKEEAERRQQEKRERREKKERELLMERERKQNMLQDLLRRSGPLSPQEEWLKDALVKEFMSG